MKKIVLIALMSLNWLIAYPQGIGVNNPTPHASALLDLTDPIRGLLVPRVALTATNVANPITAPATSLMVYNTVTAGAFPNAVSPGYYYWSGTAWNRFRDTGTNDSWSLSGNAGTSAVTNFIGTTDAVDFVIRTSNAERMRISFTGNVGIASTAPFSRLVVTGSGSTSVSSSLNVRNSLFQSMLFVRDDNSVGVGTATPNASAALDVTSVTKGMLIPRMTSAQRVAIPAPATGLIVYETPTNLFYYFDGLTWRVLLSELGGWKTTGNAGTNIATNFLGTTDLVDFAIRTNNTQRMRIKSNGQIGVNLSVPFAQLDVFSNGLTDTIVFRARNNSALGTICQIGSIELFKDYSNTVDFNNGVNSAQFAINLANNGTRDLQLGFDDAGKPGTSTWVVVSDKRLKEDIHPFKDGLETLSKINPVYYKYNGKASTPTDEYYVGVVAQDLAEAAPYMVSTFEYTPDPRDLDNRETYFDVNNGAMTYILINAVKELEEKTEKLKAISRNITDFGQTSINGRETFIPFSQDFAGAISGGVLPVVTVSAMNAANQLYVKEVQHSGFIVVVNDDAANLQVNWIAAGKISEEQLRISKSYTESERNELLHKVVRKPSLIKTTEEALETERRKLEESNSKE